MQCHTSSSLLGSHHHQHACPPHTSTTAPACSLPRPLCLPASRQLARRTPAAATLRREQSEEQDDLQGLQFASQLSSAPAAASSSPQDNSHVASLGARMVLERLYSSGGLASSSGRVASTVGADRVRAWEQQQQQPILCLPQVLEQQQTVTEEKEQQTTPSEQGYRGGGGGGQDPRNNLDFFANLGDAIRTLRDDIPDLFNRDLNYDIYRDDIVFRDPRNKFEGLRNYRIIFWSLRFHGKLFFSRLYVEVKRVWQPANDRQTIKMRWTVHGVPRVPWEAEGLFDGVSTYKLDSAGKIYEHAVDNVMLRDPPMQLNSPLLATINLLRQPQTQPYPGIPTTFQGCTEERSNSSKDAHVHAASNSASNSTSNANIFSSLLDPQGSMGSMDEECLSSSCSNSSSGVSKDGMSALSARFSWVRLYAALMGSVALVQALAGLTQQGGNQQDGSPPAALT